ncbi:MAG: hypothetical protein GY859_09155 [Desulfobacterales bacterium]|nr:hypothetical protein [Desulfobacterales bacterium]
MAVLPWFSGAMILSALPPTSGFVGKRLFFGPLKPVPGDHPNQAPPLTMSLPLPALPAAALFPGLFPGLVLILPCTVVGVL